MSQNPWGNPQQQASNEPDPLEGGDKAPAVSFNNAPVGTVVCLEVTSQAKLVQSRNYETGELDYWPGNVPGQPGNPKMAVVINGTVNGEERSLWATKPSSMLAALQAAQKQAGQRIGPGGKLWVKFDHETPHPTNPKLNAKKEYVAKYEPPDALASAPDFAQQAAQPPAAQQGPPPAQQYQQPQAAPAQQDQAFAAPQQYQQAPPQQTQQQFAQAAAAPQAQPAPQAAPQQGVADPFANAAPQGAGDPPF